ncbi:MAG TPA: CHAT domain-containing protein [Blastocatellia bacterium]|nr:CHAT domain-containing protein [Blastocatellia bacterium]
MRPLHFTRRWLFITVGVGILLLIAGLIWRGQRPSYTAKAMALVVREFADQRPVEGRLTGGLKGGRFVPPADEPRVPSPEMIKASRLLDEAMQRGEPGARLANARLLLLVNEKGSATLKAFRQAAEAEPSNVAAVNDLGVCRLARGELEAALATFDDALKQQPDMPEALFNRALTFEQLQLRDAASEDYSRLLEIERDPSWREEIQARHEAVSALVSQRQVVEAFDRACETQDFAEAGRIADSDFESVNKHVSTHCLLDYFKAMTTGDLQMSERELGKIQFIGNRLAATFGDKSLLDLAAYAQRLSPADAAAEVAVMSQYNNMLAPRVSRTATETLAIALKLSDQFRARSNRFCEFVASFQAATSLSQVGRFADAIRKMTEALKFAESNGWPYRHAYGLMQLGNLYSRIGQDSLTLKYCQMANIEGRGTPYVVAKTTQYMANACWHLGNVAQGLKYLRQSSQLSLTEVPSLSDLAFNMLQAADFYRQTDRHDLALYYARQSLRYAKAKHAPSRIAQAASFIAVELAQRHELDASDAAMRKARAALGKGPAREQAYTQYLLRLRAGDIAAQRNDLEQAEAQYAEAQRIAENSEEKPLPLIKVLKARAASYTRTGHPNEARADLKRAIELIEDYRKRVSDQSNRSDFFDASQEVFDQMLQLEAHAFGQPVAAFNISEQARARTLLDDLAAMATAAAQAQASAANRSRQSAHALTLEEIRRRLPADLTLISYSVSRDGTMIFVVTRDAFKFAESTATTEMLDRLVQDYVAAMNDRVPVEELSGQARRLYDLLIAPVEAELRTTKRLCIAPDKALHRLPFAALLDPASRYLAQSYVLTGAPSASTLAYCLDKSKGKQVVADEQMLAVGNPLFNRDDFSDLPALPEAEGEVRASASLYTHRVILTGAEATKARLFEELPRCDVAHFSTHCLVNEKTPWLAALLMAGTDAGKDEQLLQLNELEKFGLLRARLVILSACQSGLGQYYRGEGIVSLVRPFLARGVPTVVASLWPVDSPATAMLMIDFHRARKQNGLLAADALRDAQLRMMQSDSYNHPFYWAPFVVIGSNN